MTSIWDGCYISGKKIQKFFACDSTESLTILQKQSDTAKDIFLVVTCECFRTPSLNKMSLKFSYEIMKLKLERKMMISNLHSMNKNKNRF